MPKKSGADRKTTKGTPRKGAGPKSRRGGVGLSDEDSVCDTASVVSLNSERGSFEDGDNGNFEDYDDGASSGVTVLGESLDEKIAEAIDGMTEKSANIRTNSLNTLVTLLSQQFRPDLLLGRRETLRDNLERILKRGQPNEQGLAAQLYSLTAIQLGALDPDMASEDFTAIKPCLQSLLLDHTASMAVRAKCCEALCLGGFVAETCLQDVANIVTILEPLFGSKSVIKPESLLPEKSDAFGIGASPAKSSVKIPKCSSSSLAAAAVSGWSLLLTVMGQEYLSSRVHRWTRVLQALLDQPDLEVRLNVGEALAILVDLCELGVDSDTYSSEDEDEDSEDSGTNGHSNGVASGKKTNMKHLISKLRELSVESHKYRAKKDRRQQHHSFRDYLHAVEDGDGPRVAMKFGAGEVLEIDSWGRKRQYDAICKVLGSGINRHLVENPLVRNIMELGAPRPVVTDPAFGNKQAKSERQYMNAMNFKARSVNRGKSRDHRMADLADD